MHVAEEKSAWCSHQPICVYDNHDKELDSLQGHKDLEQDSSTVGLRDRIPDDRAARTHGNGSRPA